MAIMAVREGLEFETTIESDCAPLAGLVADLLAAGIEIHCLRDLTRGGLASALIEIAEAAQVQIHIREAAVPVGEEVRGACEILGFDPLYVANEGRFVCFRRRRPRRNAPSASCGRTRSGRTPRSSASWRKSPPVSSPSRAGSAPPASWTC